MHVTWRSDHIVETVHKMIVETVTIVIVTSSVHDAHVA